MNAAELRSFGVDEDTIAKGEVVRHLWNHGVLVSTHDFYAMSLDEIRALDPCEVKP